MNHCDSCRMLGLMPLRRDVPSHLRRYSAGDVRIEGVRLTTYECSHCESLWRWYAVDGWMRAELAEEARAREVLTFNESFA
ncbi:MAG: hypothetical protein M3O62_13650 [Pseudomonadota bacterium]|nr:hypothetical protein [Pseudomonadota bacterium]